MMENEQENSILSRLIDAFLKVYSPADSAASADEMKSTQDLIEEMNRIEEE